MRISFVQFSPEYLQRRANWRQAEMLLAGEEADLVVLPELFTSGYFFRSTDDAAQVAEPIPEGPTTEWLAAWSKKTGASFVAGLPERDGDKLYNSAVVVAPTGYVGRYRKLHLYYEEKLHFEAGNEGLPVYEMADREGNLYQLGVMICFDWFYPEAARSLALQGADIIAHPSNLVRRNCPRAMPIRALENHVFTVTANRIGRESNGEEELSFIGQSLICSPQGETLIQADRDVEAVGTVEIDPRAARDRKITRHNDQFADRRPEAYSPLLRAVTPA